MKVLHYLIAIAAGGVATSFAEYFFKYNLVDLVKDKILGLFGSGKKELAAIEATVSKKL